MNFAKRKSLLTKRRKGKALGGRKKTGGNDTRKTKHNPKDLHQGMEPREHQGNVESFSNPAHASAR